MSGYDVEMERKFALAYIQSYVFGDKDRGSGCIIDNTTLHTIKKEYVSEVEGLCLDYCRRAVDMFVHCKLTRRDVVDAERNYYNKPQIVTGKTWVDAEYSSPAFQFVYLSRKLVRRVVMVLNMCVNAYKMGIFLPSTLQRLVVHGSGPCVEGAVVQMMSRIIHKHSVKVVAYDRNDWSWLVPDSIDFRRESWNNQKVVAGDSVFVSYVLEHYFTLPLDEYRVMGVPVYSIEKEYFIREHLHRNLCDFTGNDTSCVVYLKFKYNPSTWIVNYSSWVDKSEAVPEAHFIESLVPDVAAFDTSQNRVKERLGWVSEFGLKGDAYLDVGCGDMSVTNDVAAQIGAEEYVGVDTYCSEQPNYLRIDDYLPLPADCFDVVTAFVSLHHIVDLHGMLGEIARVSKTGASLLIREHDAAAGDVLWLDFVHLIDSYERGEKYKAFVDGYYAQYNSREHWRLMLESFGFKSVRYRSYDGLNPQNLYYELFKYEGGVRNVPNVLSGFSPGKDIIRRVMVVYPKRASNYALKHGVAKEKVEYLSLASCDEDWYDG
jgi:ubiquinone/menaquinone biosynthesis C-methylase UbiE